MIRQIAAGMKLSNVEVAITYDSSIDVKEFTIRGLLLPTLPRGGGRREKEGGAKDP